MCVNLKSNSSKNLQLTSLLGYKTNNIHDKLGHWIDNLPNPRLTLQNLLKF